MSTQALPMQKGQALPCVLTREEVRRAAASWLLDSKIRQLSPNTLYSRKLVTVKLVCGPGDEAEPVITLLRPDED